MNSVWYDMGIRDGRFTGVRPSSFLNAAYRFFFDLYMRSRQSLEPEWKPLNFEKKNAFRFNGLRKWDLDGTERSLLLSGFSFQSVPFGSPLTQEYWGSDTPDWSYDTLYPAESALIGEEIVSHPIQQMDFKKCLRRSGEFLWERQRYKLIEKMRFCTIPLKVQRRSKGDSGWTEFPQKHHINQNLSWENENQYKITVPSYWCAEGIGYKIGIFAKTLSAPGLKTAVEGCYWLPASSFVTPRITGTEAGFSEVRIYGAVDLATHPDFKHYFQL